MVTSFYQRREWLELRYRVLRKHGARCLACGQDRRTAGQIHVDHIKPISIYPELALTESNLQTLCRMCNIGKSNRYEDDYRPTAAVLHFAEEKELQRLIASVVESACTDTRPGMRERYLEALGKIQAEREKHPSEEKLILAIRSILDAELGPEKDVP